MGHNLNYRKDRKEYAFYSKKEVPWHKLGQITNGGETSEQVIRLANLDYEVVKVPQVILRDDIINGSPNVVNNINMHCNVRSEANHYAGIIKPQYINFSTVRTDTEDVLGSVGRDYEVIQNWEAFEFIDQLIGRKEAVFETAGALGKGETIFISIKLPTHLTFTNKDDIAEQYMLLTSSHDGSRNIECLFTPVRVVCNNTLNLALDGQCVNRIKLKHTKNVRNKLADLQGLMGLHNSYIDSLQETIDNMKNVSITDAYARDVMFELILSKDELALVKSNNNNLQGVDEISTNKKNTISRLADWTMNGAGQDTEVTKLWLFNGISGYYNNARPYETETDRFNSLFYGDSAKKVNKLLSILQ